MRRVVPLFLSLAALLVGIVFWRMNPAAPPGQEQLAVLGASNFAAFEQAFDAASAQPRLVLLLSPT